jgi:hypothetical protein
VNFTLQLEYGEFIAAFEQHALKAPVPPLAPSSVLGMLQQIESNWKLDIEQQLRTFVQYLDAAGV